MPKCGAAFKRQNQRFPYYNDYQLLGAATEPEATYWCKTLIYVDHLDLVWGTVPIESLILYLNHGLS